MLSHRSPVAVLLWTCESARRSTLMDNMTCELARWSTLMDNMTCESARRPTLEDNMAVSQNLGGRLSIPVISSDLQLFRALVPHKWLNFQHKIYFNILVIIS